MHQAILINKDNNNKITSRLSKIGEEDLPKNDVKVKIEYSTLNYKDCLAITNKSPIARTFPLVPGIDLAGTVLEASSDKFIKGDKVFLNGWGHGEIYWGGLATIANLDSKYLLHLPKKLDTLDVMCLGTAGYTAMLAVMEIEKKKLNKEKSEILVTGSNGGVGSISIMILSKLGYNVIAATSRLDNNNYIKSLGAKEVISYETLLEKKKVLEREKWSASIDVLGGQILSSILSTTKYEGTAIACGLASDFKVNTSVFPFILRGVSLIGIDSVYRNNEDRIQAWKTISELLEKEKIYEIIKTIKLEEVIDYSEKILSRKIAGRIVVKL